MEFSVLNESSLHNTLKTYYAIQSNGQTEYKLHNHIYDIYTENNQAIEIQTQNLVKLLPKILDTLEKGIKVKLVHTVVVTKTITLFNKENEKISKRKSPKKGCIYDLFSELTGIYHILLRENFTLEVLLIDITEQRIRTEEPVQSKNNRRRFKRNWNKTNKHLDQIIKTITFNKKEDYLNLLPKNLPEEFCAKDINKLLKENNSIPKNYRPNGNLIIWVFNRMELIEQTKVENRSRYYRIKQIN